MSKLMRDADPVVAPHQSAVRLGLWSSALTSLVGLVYIGVLASAALSGALTFPPDDALQLFGGVSSLLLCPLIVVVFVALSETVPPAKRVWALVGSSFAGLFALSVSVNRFTQLGAVRRHIEAGSRVGLDWFLPYDDRSAMFGLELLGWGWFLGLAMIAAAGAFGRGRLDTSLRWLCAAYGAIGMASAVFHLVGSPLSAIGFVAWGLLLFVITALLTVRFRRAWRRNG